MFVLIVVRRGITIGVYTHAQQHALRGKAERLDGNLLTWRNYVSHIAAHSAHDDERVYEVHQSEVL